MSPGWLLGLLPGLYFLGLSEGLAFLLRRWFDPVPPRLRLAFLAAIVFLLGGVLFGGSILLPLDNLRTAIPFRDLAPSVPPSHGVQGDQVHQIAPWMLAVRDSFGAGGWPLWNPLSGAGMPLLADPQAQVLQPLVGLTLPVPFWSSIGVLAALRIWVALVFTYLLLRRQGLGEPAALAGAFAFGLSGFLLLWLGWPLATCAALLPATLYAATLCEERGARRDHVLLGLAVAALFLGGHPESMIYGAGLLAVFLLDRAWRRGRAPGLRFLARTGTTLLLAAGLAAPILLPTLDFLPTTARAVILDLVHAAPPPPKAAPAGDGDGDGEKTPSAPLWEGRERAGRRLAAVLAPRAFGTLDFYWGDVNAIEDGAGFTGMAATLLAALALLPLRGRRRAPQEALMAGVLLASLALIAQPAGFDRLLARLPGLKATVAHQNHRILLLVAFGLAYLAACELDRWLRGEGRRGWCLALAASLAATVGLVFWRWPPPSAWSLSPSFQGWPLAGQVGAIAAAALLLWAVSRRGPPDRGLPRRAAGWAVCGLVALELLATLRTVNPPAPRRLLYPRLPPLRFLAEHLGTDRFVGFGSGAFSANFGVVYGLRDVRVNNPAVPFAYESATMPVQRSALAASPLFGRPLHPLYDLLGARYVIARPGVAIPLPLVFRDPTAWIFERPRALPRLFLPGTAKPHRAGSWIDFLGRNPDFAQRALVMEPGSAPQVRSRTWKAANPDASTITVTSETATRIAGRGLLAEPRLLASNVFQDGHWRVLSNGVPAPRVTTNGAFAGAWLPAGEQRVDLLYRPAPFWIGCLLCALALALALTLATPRPVRPSRVVSSRLDGPPHA